MVTSTGKPIQHRDLFLALLDSVQKPAQVAICKCAAHKKGTDPITQGNALADRAAKEAAGGKQEIYSCLVKPAALQKKKSQHLRMRSKMGIYTSTEGKLIFAFLIV